MCTFSGPAKPDLGAFHLVSARVFNLSSLLSVSVYSADVFLSSFTASIMHLEPSPAKHQVLTGLVQRDPGGAC